MSSMRETWWVASLGKMLVWSRLRIKPSGTAEVFDCDGRTLQFDSEESASAALLDAEFRAFDGLDEDDASALGFVLEVTAPPSGDSDEALRGQMIQALPTVQ